MNVSNLDIEQKSFIRSASMHILCALVKDNSNKDFPTLANNAVNLAFALNDQLQKRFK